MDLDDIDPEDILKAVLEGGRRARLAHKQAGLHLVSWVDGKVVLIPPEEIVVGEPEPGWGPPAANHRPAQLPISPTDF